MNQQEKPCQMCGEQLGSLAKRFTKLAQDFEAAFAIYDKEKEQEVHEARIARVEANLGRRLGEEMRLNFMLQDRLEVCRAVLQMVLDANKDEPHIPPTALASIEQAIKRAEEALR